MTALSKHHIAIEGIIGVGKTTLARKVAELCLGKLVYELFEDNPFLSDFYSGARADIYEMELHFLRTRQQQLREISNIAISSDTPVVSDFSLDKSLIFASINLPDNRLSDFKKEFYRVRSQLAEPRLKVYIKANPELSYLNIMRRGRSIEKNVKMDYILKLHDAYEEHFQSINHSRSLITIPQINPDSNDTQEVAERIIKEYEKMLGRL